MKMNTYNELKSILDDVQFNAFYLARFHNRAYKITYTDKPEDAREHDGVAAIAEYYDEYYQSNYGDFFETMQGNAPAEEESLEQDFVYCLKVLDWGKVTNSNLFDIIFLYERSLLSRKLTTAKLYFNDDNSLLVVPSSLTWSAGWTKIYSLISYQTTIYDSRVCAFINYICVHFSRTLRDSKLHEFQKVSNYFYTQGGTNDKRVRKIGSDDRDQLGMKRASPGNDQQSIVGNKVASWFIRYISESNPLIEDTQKSFRQYDKAFFMLGFDFSQL